MKKLTTEMLKRFVGGQMEIQNEKDGYLYRGEIETIAVEDDTLKVRFAWLAKGEGDPSFPNKWVKSDRLAYSRALFISSVSDIGPSGGVGGGNRLCLNSLISWETVILYPHDGSKLDPAKVEGLQPPAASQEIKEERKISFEFEGTTYECPARAYETGEIVLPDGRVLEVSGWLESLPPQPYGLRMRGTIALATVKK